MSYFLVPPLEALRAQLNRIAPQRDRRSDGWIGDTSHAASASSHNPDRSGSPEWRDGDSKDEVRGLDLDSDLKVPGLSMERFVQHLIEGCRSGWIWWLEYIIYRGRIWTRSGGWRTQTYSGSNPHDEHVHVNGRFTNKADSFTGADYRLEELVDDMPTADEVAKAILSAPLDRPEWSPVAKDKPTMRLDAVLETTLNLVGGEQRAALAAIQARQDAILKAVSGQKGDAILAELQAQSVELQAQSAKQQEAFVLLAELAEVIRETGDPAAVAALERTASAVEGIASTMARS